MPEPKPLESRIARFRKGDIIFSEGEDTQDFYIVKNGSVKIFRTEGLQEVTLDTLGPGNVAGEISFIDSGIRTASGIAIFDAELIVISKDEFRNIFNKIPDWFRKISLILVQRLREVDEKISRSINKDFTSYVAALVYMISFSEKAHKVDKGYEIDQKFLEYELMDLLTIPLAQVQTSLERLAAQKALTMTGGKVVLTDREKCERLSNELLKGPATTGAAA